MNPLNRKMFRQPGVSRQPTGILASSPQLANAVRRRMNQPVQMAHGGYHPPGDPMGRLSTSRRPVPGKVRMPLVDLLPAFKVGDVNFGNIFSDATGRQPLVQSEGGRQRSAKIAEAIPDASVGDVNLGNILSDATGRRPIGQSEGGRKRSAALVDAPGKIASGLRSGIGQVFDRLGDLIPDSTPTVDVPDDVRQNQNIANLRNLRSTIAQRQGRVADPTLDPDITLATGTTVLQDDPDLQMKGGQPTAAEELAALRLDPKVPPEGPPTTATDGRPRKVSTTDPEKKPNVSRNKLKDLLTQVQNNSPEQVSKVGPKLNADEAATPEAAEALKLTLPEESSLSDMEAMAKKIMGFDPSKSKEAKRDSFWRNLTMAGLAIAAGESDNALTNVAKGLMVGMDSYSKDIKDINAQEAEERKEYRATLRDLIKTDKDSAIAMATLKNNHAYKVADLNQRRDQFKSTQDFQRAKLELDNSLANKQLEVQITTSLATLDLKQETLDETKKQNAITNSQNKLKNMPAFQQTAVGLKYLVLDDESGEYEWTEEGQAWIDRNASAILAASVTGSKKSGPKAPDRDRYILDALGDTEQLDTARDALKAAGIDDPTDRQLEAYFGSQYDRVAGGVTAAPTTGTNTYNDATLKAATAQGLVWSPDTKAQNGKMGAFIPAS